MWKETSIKPEKKFLSPKQLSERWNGVIKERTLANWRHIGEGPGYTKVGGKIQYPMEKILEYEKKRTRSYK